MRVVISCSIDSKEKEFLDEMGLSASELLQGSIQQAIENSKIGQAQVKEYQRKIAFLQETMNKQRDFIESKSLMGEFLQNV